MSGTAADFPGTYPVLIGSRSFAVSTFYEPFRRQSFHHDTIPSQRESVDLTDVPGEGTINTEGLWRRGQISWHKGSGQLYLDRKESDDYRFLNSLGIDPWNENQATLLPDTLCRLDTSAQTYGNTVKVINVNSYAWVLETSIPPTSGSNPYRLRYTADWSTYTTPTGLPSNDITDIASDGRNVFIAGFYGTGQGVFVSQPSGSSWGSFAQIITDAVERVWWAGDRLFCSVGPQLWDITACSGGAQALGGGNAVLVMQHINPDWKWSDMTAGESFVYAAGIVSNATDPTGIRGESAVYQFSTSPDFGGLTPGVDLTTGLLAWQPPVGEQVHAIEAYSNFIFLGTTQGVRCCRTVSPYDPSGKAGDLISGPLLPNLTAPFNAPFTTWNGTICGGFVGIGRFVWFLWPQFAYGGTTYWGLGRLDLGTFVAELQPAYASDLMTACSSTSTLLERGCVFWDPASNGPGFIIPGGVTQAGVYTSDFNSTVPSGYKYVSQGFLRSGRITYGMQDNKTLAQANLKSGTVNLYAPFDTAGGGITLDVSYDSTAFQSLAPLAPNQQANPPVLVSPLTAAEEIEVEAILSAGTTSHTNDHRPFLNRWTIKSLPNVVSGILIFVALDLYTENDMQGTTDFTDPYGDYAYLENLRLSQDIITYKEGNNSSGATQFQATVVVQELYWMPQQRRDNADAGYEGTLVVTLKSIVG